MKLKPIHEQVIVITGGSSGIGLVTARMAARRGAKVVIASRNEPALHKIVSEIRQAGGQATYALADVSREHEVRRIAEVAIETFGRIDTWVNNAAVSIYGPVIDVPLQEHRRLFDVNYFGMLHGSLVAVEHLRERGGALINLASVLADRSIPQQGAYCASKHAIKGLTESLRMELEEQGLPISVSLIKPSAIDTPYKKHAKNYLSKAPKNPPPVYAPEVVANAILHCAEHRKRQVIVGGGGWAVSLLGTMMPRLSDYVMEHVMSRLQLTDEPPAPRDRHSLFAPMEDGEERGVYPHHVSESSLYTQMSLHPLATAAIAGAVGVLAFAAVKGARMRTPRQQLAGRHEPSEPARRTPAQQRAAAVWGL